MLNNGSTNETTPNQCYICDKKYNGSTSKIIRDSLRRHISSVHGAYTLVFAKLAHSSVETDSYLRNTNPYFKAAPQPLPDKPNRPNLTCCNYCFVCGKKYNGATPKIVKDSLRRHIASAHASYSLIFAKIVRSAVMHSSITGFNLKYLFLDY
jgi:hypothetical protein